MPAKRRRSISSTSSGKEHRLTKILTQDVMRKNSYTMCDCIIQNLDIELTLFFFHETLKKTLITDYLIPVEEEICVKKHVPELIEETQEEEEKIDDQKNQSYVSTQNQKRYSQTKSENLKETKSIEGLNLNDTKKRSSSSDTKEQPVTIKKKRSLVKRSSSTANSLRPITEDNSEPEKLISTTIFELDWLVERSEKDAKILFKNGNIYEGNVRNKVPHGKGTFWWADGTVYEGDFQDGVPTGKGVMQLADMTEYKGSFYKGFFHGHGVYNIRSTTSLYSGGWKYGKKHGDGWLLYEPAVWYEGEFQNDLRQGNGFFQFGNGSCYEGCYVNNKRQGQGAMRWSNNDVMLIVAKTHEPEIIICLNA